MKKVVFSAKHFTWLHVPKTGGTWLYRILTTLHPPAWEAKFGMPTHVRLHEVVESLTAAGVSERVSAPILAAVRNPWEWYVSLYFFMEQHYQRGTGGFGVPRSQWSPGCKAWQATYTRGDSAAGFRKSLPVMLERMHSGDEAVVPVQSVFLKAPDGSVGVRPVRFETLRHGMIAAIEATGAAMPPRMRQQILRRPKQNISGHAAYQACYDDASRKLVASYERWLIETFEYVF